MATWTRFLQFSVICTVLLTSADKRVFRSQLEANTVLQRPRRSNTFLLEEILQGNLERECYEESCTFEEAREYFEDIPKTEAFWAVYRDGDQCNPNPCLNGANCTDKIGGYRCECKEFYDGVNCERDVSQCHSEGPWSCDHFCRPTFNSYHCTCAGGYKLHSDRRTCLPEAQNPCGRAPVPELREPKWTDLRSSPASQLCPHGRCPWQVSLLDAAGRREICSGVVLGQRSILTAAVCASMSDRILVALGEQPAGQQELAWPDEQPRPPRGPGQVSPVSQVFVHKRYRQGEPGDDLAFLHVHRPIRLGAGVFQACVPEKDFSENVLMESGQGGWVADREAGGRRGSPNHLSYLPLEDCRTSLNLSFPLTNKMFCMAGWGGGGCGLLPGTPVVSVRKNTVFLTGLITSPQTHNCSQGHVFTKLSRYLPWIHQQLELSEK
ncbi:protein Z, vitamin K-dependent plasma glycoprotein b isoform X1 [Anguilla anguilla]|uniref:protein Z, vitamin K-dependent plasma glycoprotein b isoform X1 n=1 Tax=Anguilla anguilla TaxID=7936 RepID=UPI0015A76A7D|nr:protein Z, vitamin K-dependent plasma glycoprotein b isoform X1 [Anguilla anguilla]